MRKEKYPLHRIRLTWLELEPAIDSERESIDHSGIDFWQFRQLFPENRLPLSKNKEAAQSTECQVQEISTQRKLVRPETILGVAKIFHRAFWKPKSIVLQLAARKSRQILETARLFRRASSPAGY